MSIESLFAFSLALGIAALIPGPGILGLLGWTLGRGGRAAFGYSVGLILGDLTYLCLAVGGLAALAETMGEAFLVVKLAGAAYLIWMGVKIWRSSSLSADAEAKKGSLLAAGAAGLTTTLSNPKTIVFYMGVMPMVLDLHGLTLAMVAELMIAATIVLTLVLIPYALAANRARTVIRSQKAMARLNKGAGAVLIGAGAAVAAS
jgi:threonine/homoserine/homoserine lactone efflux protein